MKPFNLIATPHKDILEGRLTLDVFGADLWTVYNGTAPAEYKDKDLFFKKTYITNGLNNLLDIAHKRISGNGGDSVIQLQTPFGGGKTHSLIALYHKAKEWDANVVVFDGTVYDVKDRPIWEEIEYQLTGKVEILKGSTSPGKEKLYNLLSQYQPLVILMDEILNYANKAAGIKVGDSNLANQLLSFLQEFTGVMGILEKSILIVTLPSSVITEDYDERLYQQIQKVIGRLEKVYTPVSDEEVPKVITRRLFSEININEAKRNIDEFLNYAEKEKILPEGVEKSIYRERFIESFPFQPEVIDVLYKRWGSFPTFQRTRGVLRLLALVVSSLLNEKLPYIRLSDFRLDNEEIRKELVKHAGSEFDAVIANDIVSRDSGAKKVDKSLGDSYTQFSFGTKVATTIFMYSFPQSIDKQGASINEVKLSSCVVDVPNNVVGEAISTLKEKLFYISDEGLFFSNEPNLNKLILVKTENVHPNDVEKEEKNSLLPKYLSKDFFDCFIWPNNSRDIPDNRKLKLIILRNLDKCKEILENYSDRLRIYRNTMFFLCADDSEQIAFENFVKKLISLRLIQDDSKVKLTEKQKKELKDKLMDAEESVRGELRKYYRMLRIPSKDGFEEEDLGIPTFGVSDKIDKEIYDFLKAEEKILEKLHPTLIVEKYLADNNFVQLKRILDSFYSVPGEIRIASEEVLRLGVREGIKNHQFGIGHLVNDKPECEHFGDDYIPAIVDEEVLIKANLCKVKGEGVVSEDEYRKILGTISSAKSREEALRIKEEAKSLYTFSPEQVNGLEQVVNKIGNVKPSESSGGGRDAHYKNLSLKLGVPVGKLADIARTIAFLQSKFSTLEIKVEINAENGELTKADYEDKIKEAINQAGIKVEEEKQE
jgi:hypothetical protein